jgi:hypothetical protein
MLARGESPVPSLHSPLPPLLCRDLRLKYLSVYELHIRLPYPVFDKKGVAKFEKAKKQLSITLPVQPALPAPQANTTAVQEVPLSGLCLCSFAP